MSGAFGRSPGLGDGALRLGIDAARSHPCELEGYVTFPSLCFLDWEMGSLFLPCLLGQTRK